jgi:hypothetical protein
MIYFNKNITRSMDRIGKKEYCYIIEDKSYCRGILVKTSNSYILLNYRRDRSSDSIFKLYMRYRRYSIILCREELKRYIDYIIKGILE